MGKEPPDWDVPQDQVDVLSTRYTFVSRRRKIRDLRERFRELLSEADDYAEFLHECQNELVVFFALCSEAINDHCEELFVLELMADEYVEKEGVTERAVVNQLRKKTVTELLKHYGAIPDDLHDDISEVQNTRGFLVHDPQTPKKVTSPASGELNTPGEVARKVELGIRTVEDLAEMVDKARR